MHGKVVECRGDLVVRAVYNSGALIWHGRVVVLVRYMGKVKLGQGSLDQLLCGLDVWSFCSEVAPGCGLLVGGGPMHLAFVAHGSGGHVHLDCL